MAGLPDASLTLTGTWAAEDGDWPSWTGRRFPRATQAPFVLHAPDGCVLLTGLTAPVGRNESGQVTFDVEVTYNGRTPDGRHWHTLGWWGRLTFRLRRLAGRL